MNDKQIIAQDVLKWVNTQRIRPFCGLYFDDNVSDILRGIYGEVSVQTLLPLLKRCEVCAIGAAVLCSIDRYNKCNVSEMASMMCNINKAEDHTPFSLYELRQIELWFECDDITGGMLEDDEPWSDKWSWLTDKERMVAIFSNIVEYGQFEPTKLNSEWINGPTQTSQS